MDVQRGSGGRRQAYRGTGKRMVVMGCHAAWALPQGPRIAVCRRS